MSFDEIKENDYNLNIPRYIDTFEEEPDVANNERKFEEIMVNNPNIRFAGFADEWEECKLSELIQKGGSGGTPKSTNKTFYDGNIPFLGISDISKSNGYIDNTEKHISENGLNNSSAWIVPKGAISLAMYASVGKLAILNINAATSQAFYNMLFEYESIRDYVYHRLGKANDLGEWTKLISTGTQANLNADKVKNFKIQVPQNIDEMTDISTFFNQLDNTIAHHQRKLDLLKDLKKGYLQKMFPKNGATEPEIRFVGFADDWEERKLGELAKSFEYGLNASAKEFDGYHKYIRITDIDDCTHEFIQNKLTSPDVDFTNADKYILQRGDILFARTGASVGKSYYYKENDGLVYFAGFLIRARIKPEVSPKFVFQNTLTSKYNKFITITSQRSGQPGVNAEEYSNFKMMVPSYEEQQQIGNFFKQLDNTIDRHQRKLDLLKDLKKGLSQQLFV